MPKQVNLRVFPGELSFSARAALRRLMVAHEKLRSKKKLAVMSVRTKLEKSKRA